MANEALEALRAMTALIQPSALNIALKRCNLSIASEPIRFRDYLEMRGFLFSNHTLEQIRLDYIERPLYRHA